MKEMLYIVKTIFDNITLKALIIGMDKNLENYIFNRQGIL